MTRTLRDRARSALLSAPLSLGCVLLCMPACSTLKTLGSGERYLLGGTREDVDVFSSERDEDYWIGLGRCLAIFDFPWSLALDLLLTPVTLPLQLLHGDEPKPGQSPKPE